MRSHGGLLKTHLKAAWEQGQHNLLFSMQEELHQDHSVLLVAKCRSSEVEMRVGLVLMWCLADEAQILELAVHPDFRRLGIGLMLMDNALAEGGKYEGSLPFC